MDLRRFTGNLYGSLRMQPWHQRLPRYFFVHKITVEDRNIRKVIVCHNALQSEQVYPVNDQCAYVNIYSEDARILFEDEKRRRFGTTVAYKDQQLMDNRDLARQCASLRGDESGLCFICAENCRPRWM